MNFQDFKNKWETDIKPNRHPDIREGQSLMNFLGEVWIEEYKRLSSVHYYDQTNIDCFYNDKLIPNTLNHLEKEWKNYPF